ncbi:hypothetical protein EV127DRAFT_426133 [Xylaria flabelliformis]|nr:hypothetical protein EV127DRAFT_426133 [Xylaria flabelliformis]
MHYTKIHVLLAALLGTSVSKAQQFPDPACGMLAEDLIEAAPTIPPALSSYINSQETNSPSPGDLLRDPSAYVEQLCGLAGSLPQSLLVEFQGWGSSLLNYASVEISAYDNVVTKCITTGTAAASITSYIHEIAESPNSHRQRYQSRYRWAQHINSNCCCCETNWRPGRRCRYGRRCWCGCPAMKIDAASINDEVMSHGTRADSLLARPATEEQGKG